MFGSLPFIGSGIKTAIVTAFIIAVLGAVWYALDSWHFSKVRELKTCEQDQASIVKFYDGEIRLKDINISNLTGDLKACEVDIDNSYSDGYYRGLSDVNETFTINSHYAF